MCRVRGTFTRVDSRVRVCRVRGRYTRAGVQE